MQRGVTCVGLDPGTFSREDADLTLKQLFEAGVEWLALTIGGYQENICSTTISTHPLKTLEDGELQWLIQKARLDFGFKVMLKPHVELNKDNPENNQRWRGEIGKNFTSDDWKNWFKSYRKFISSYAEIASSFNVEQFCVGTELKTSTFRRPCEWMEVVQDVRKLFGGELTYAAGWDEAEYIQIWNHEDLKYIGVDAYYQLRDKGGEKSVIALMEGWKPHLDRLAALSKRYDDKKILFTEIGFLSNVGTTYEPWKNLCGSVDLEEQSNAYEATFCCVGCREWFAGLFWYAWSIDPNDGGHLDDGYTPHNKPAENIMRKYYGREPHGQEVTDYPPEPNESITEVIFGNKLNPSWKNYSSGNNVSVDAKEPDTGDGVISVTLPHWGSLYLEKEREAIDSRTYHWLEFKIRGLKAGGQHLWAFLWSRWGNEDDTQRKNCLMLRPRPVDDERYIKDGIISTEWKNVRIPLSHLNAGDKRILAVSLQDRCGDGAEPFLIKDLRLLGSTASVTFLK